MKFFRLSFWAVIIMFASVFLLSGETSAVSATNITYNQMGANFSRGSTYDPVVTVINTGASNLPVYVMTNYDTTVKAFSFGSNSFSLNSPLGTQTGISYNIKVSFSLAVPGAEIPFEISNNLIGYSRFNEGTITNENSTITVNRINQENARFTIQTSANLSSSTALSSIYVYIQNSVDQIGRCSNYPGSSISPCGLDGQAVLLKDVDITVIVSQDPNTALLGQISNKLDDLNSSITSTSPPSNQSDLSNSVGWLPPGPVDSILNLPLNFLNGLLSAFSSEACSPLSVPLPFVNSNLMLPCLRPIFNQMGLTLIIEGVGAIISAFLLFDFLKWIYKFVDDTLTLRENNSGLWGGF